MEIEGPFFRSSRGPEIWSYATGVDFVFVFQEDTFYPTRRQKDSNFKLKWFNMYTIKTPWKLEQSSYPSDKWNDVDCIYYLIVFYT